MNISEIIEVKGKIILSSIDYNQVLIKNVIKNNTTSGKIQVPTELIGKKVYVVWKK